MILLTEHVQLEAEQNSADRNFLTHLPMPSIGVAMIVRDGEKTLQRALDSVYSRVDQIVVVDTGSLDRTAIIASRIGAELYFALWKNDFSFARNIALKAMRTDWILQLDADEELIDDLSEVAELLSDESVGGIRLTLRNLLSDQPDHYTDHHYPRLFRRNKLIRYNGIIHEQIAPSIERSGYHIASAPLRILHHGYAHITKEKTERNAALLREQMKSEMPDANSAWTQYHLAMTEFASGNFTFAQELFATALKDAQNLTKAQEENSRIRLGQIALKYDQSQEVEYWLNFSSDDVDREGLRKFVLASGRAIAGDIASAHALMGEAEVQSTHLIDSITRQRTWTSLEQLRRTAQKESDSTLRQSPTSEHFLLAG